MSKEHPLFRGARLLLTGFDTEITAVSNSEGSQADIHSCLDVDQLGLSGNFASLDAWVRVVTHQHAFAVLK